MRSLLSGDRRPRVSQEDRARVGDYVRRTLARELARQGCDWPFEFEWNEGEIRASITRGELAIWTGYRHVRWWQPVTRETGKRLVEQLAYVLGRWWAEHYRDADESGRLVFAWWEDAGGRLYPQRQETGRPVTLTLEPGCRFGAVSGGSSALVYRLGEDVGLPLPEAIGEGWVGVE